MVVSRIFLKKFIKKITKNNSKQRIFGMNIGLLMIWLRTQSKAMVAMYGLARIMMGMCNLILSLRVMAHLV